MDIGSYTRFTIKGFLSIKPTSLCEDFCEFGSLVDLSQYREVLKLRSSLVWKPWSTRPYIHKDPTNVCTMWHMTFDGMPEDMQGRLGV